MTSRSIPIRFWRPLCAAGDALLAIVALLLAFGIRLVLPLPFTSGLLPADRVDLSPLVLLAAVMAQALGLLAFDFYDPPDPRPDTELSRRLAPAVVAAAAGIALATFLAARPFARSVLLLWVVLDFLALWAWRGWLRRRLRLPRRQVAIVGSGAAAQEIAALLDAHPWLGLEVVGHLPIPGEVRANDDPSPGLGPLLGELDDLPALLQGGRVDDVILTASADSWQTRLIDRLSGLRPDHTNVLLLPGPFEALIGRMRYRSLQDVPLIEVVRASEWRHRFPGKRLLDLVVASLLLVIALPALLFGALLVRLTSSGPVLYRQVRVGKALRPFTLLKLRTMVADAERNGEEVMATHNDPRLTVVGGFLRRARLDELPQLLNVLAGEMSMVGPRPERPGFVQRYLVEIPGYAERFTVAPGVSGLAQIAGHYHSSPANKLRYDLAYLANWTIWLDLSLLVQTVKIVLTSRGV